jgi:N-acetylglutamate synthase/N-acetylornithine aminotransferase
MYIYTNKTSKHAQTNVQPTKHRRSLHPAPCTAVLGSGLIKPNKTTMIIRIHFQCKILVKKIQNNFKKNIKHESTFLIKYK